MSNDDERHIGFLISDVARLMRTAFDRRVRRPDAADRRVNRLHLTAEADLIQLRLAQIADRTVDDALALLSVAEREQFSDSMRRIKRRLQAMLEPEPVAAVEPALRIEEFAQ